MAWKLYYCPNCVVVQKGKMFEEIFISIFMKQKMRDECRGLAKLSCSLHYNMMAERAPPHVRGNQSSSDRVNTQCLQSIVTVLYAYMLTMGARHSVMCASSLHVRSPHAPSANPKEVQEAARCASADRLHLVTRQYR